MQIKIPVWHLVGGNSDSILTCQMDCDVDREIESGFLVYSFDFVVWGLEFLNSKGEKVWREIESKKLAKFEKKFEKQFCKENNIK